MPAHPPDSTMCGEANLIHHSVEGSLRVFHRLVTLMLSSPFRILTLKPGLDPATQGFLAPGTDVMPIVPALEKIWADSLGQSLAAFNFRSVTTRFNDLVYQYPIRIPERYALVIRPVQARLAAAIFLCHALSGPSPDFGVG